MIILDAKPRTKSEKLLAIRKEGSIPAVFYGAKQVSTSVSINEIAFMKAWKQAGESSVVNLKTSEGDHDALIHEVDQDPVTGKVRHADFYIIEKGKKVSVRVPLEFVGAAPAVKLGGTLVKVLHDIEIEAEAANLPHEITVDISILENMDSQINAGDISLPKGVTLLESPEEVVILVSLAKEETEEEVAPVDLSAIEISEKKGKKEEEEVVG